MSASTCAVSWSPGAGEKPGANSIAHFEFLHHDVYAPAYGPGNSLRLSAPFPVEGEAFSLVLASSVFTHLTRSQAEYYT